MKFFVISILLLVLSLFQQVRAQNCPSGSYLSSGSTCATCPAGSYSASGSTSCISCPTGIYTTSFATGSTSVSACTICAPGYAGTVTNPGTTTASGCSICPANSYSFGSSSSCSSCPSGSTLVSSSLGCRPSSTSSSSPIDTSFYLSGSQSESISAFTSIVNANGLTYYSSSSSFPNAALVVTAGSYLSTPLLSSLPTGSSPFTVSSWVKCDASSLTESNPSNVVISWGTSQLSTTSTGSLTSATLAVTSVGRLLSPIVTVSTLAGSGSSGYADGVGTNAMFNIPLGVTVDLQGNIYISDISNHCIRKITPTGVVSTLAGSGTQGYVDGIGTNAFFNGPAGVAVDTNGNIYVADYHNHRIRKISPSGLVSTLAGNGISAFTNGVGTNARFHSPTGIAVDSSGNIYVGDTINNLLRKITPSGEVSTLASGFNSPRFVAVDTNGNVFVADLLNQRICKVTSSGVVTTLAGSGAFGYADGTGTNAIFYNPNGVTVDTNGNVLVSDFGNNYIRKITPSGVVTTLAGDGSYGFADGIGSSVKFWNIAGIALDVNGNIYVADGSNHRVRKVTFSPSLPGPLPVCDSTWHHIALTYTGSSSTNTLIAYIDGVNIATSTSTTFVISTSSSSTSSLRLGWNGLTPTSTSGELFTGSMSDLRIYSRSLTSSEIVTLSQPYLTTYTNAINPSPIASSTLYTWYCSSGSYGPTITLTRSSSDGTWSSSGSVNCQSCPANSYSYSGASSCSSCPTGSSTFVSSSLGCRPSSTSSSSPIDTSFYLSGSQSESISAFTSIVNSNGLTYYSSSTSFPNAALVVSSGSYLSTPLLSSLPTGSSPFTVSSWVKCDASSLTESNPSDVVISWGIGQMSTTSTGSLTSATLAVTSVGRLLSPIVTVSTFAGSGAQSFSDGTGTNAMFNNPSGIVVDQAGDIFVGDWGNNCIRKITSLGFVSTLAGDGTQGFADGTGTNAKFSRPNGVSLDSSGNIFVADVVNNRIRRVTPSGVVTTLAGDGTQGFADGIGTNAKFRLPNGVSVDTNGNVYVADYQNHRIRKVSSSGVVTTLAGSGTAGYLDGTGTSALLNGPTGLFVDFNGNVIVSEAAGYRIRQITPSGVVTTLAGDGTKGYVDGIGTSAKFDSTEGLTVDRSGNIYVTDPNINRIRKITPSGVVTTLAGDGTQGFADGIGTNAKIYYPTGVALDSAGNLYIAASGNNRIRKITFSPSLPGPLPVCDSTWHHIALSYSGSSSTNTLSAYIDGMNIATSTTTTFVISTSSSSTSSLRLGWNGLTPTSTSGELFTGSMSDLRIYSRSLTSSEIVTLSRPRPQPFSVGAIESSITPNTWYCGPGFSGTSTVSLTRSSSDGTWSSSGSVNCQVLSCEFLQLLG
jgi:sugar lactone lactonase YvrE